MPRVKELWKDYAETDFRFWISGRMKQLHITQSDLADDLGITQPAFAYKLKNMTFTFREQLIVLEQLEAEVEDIERFFIKG